VLRGGGGDSVCEGGGAGTEKSQEARLCHRRDSAPAWPVPSGGGGGGGCGRTGRGGDGRGARGRPPPEGPGPAGARGSLGPPSGPPQ
jgi:hypothetical protein